MQHSFTYSDGFGREIQKKIQAEPGPTRRPDSPLIARAGSDSGWTVFNNKGKPVRQYEPFFSATRHEFEFASTGRCQPDPLLRPGRARRRHAPSQPHLREGRLRPLAAGDLGRERHRPDLDPKDDPDVGDFFRRLPEADYLPTWYAQRRSAAASAPRSKTPPTKSRRSTPTPRRSRYFDTLGRTFLTIAHNRFKYSDTPRPIRPSRSSTRTRVELDIEGNQREVIDALGRIVMRYDYDMLGNRIHQASMEAGERWMLNDVTGKPIRAWDSRGFTRPHRPTTRCAGRSEPVVDGRARVGAGRRPHHAMASPGQPGGRQPSAPACVQVFDGAGSSPAMLTTSKATCWKAGAQLVQELQDRRSTGRRITVADRWHPSSAARPTTP